MGPPERMGTTPSELRRAVDVLDVLENGERPPDFILFERRTPDEARADGFSMVFLPPDRSDQDWPEDSE